MGNTDEDKDYKEILDKLSCQVVIFSEEKKVIWANEKACELHNYDKEQIKGIKCLELMKKAELSYRGFCRLEKVFENNETIREEIKDTEGNVWKIEWYKAKNMTGHIAAFLIAYNITRSRMVENRLRERSEVFYEIRSKFQKSKEKFRSLFVQNPDGICAINLKGKLISANPAIEDITGYKPEEIIDTYIYDYIISDEKKMVKRYLEKAIAGNDAEYEVILVHKEGSDVISNIKVFPMVVEGEIVAIYVIIKDISEKKRIEKKLKQRAYYDTLTGLPNRHYIDEELDKIIEQHKSAAIMFMDLDRFKRINDSLGHRTGDKLLNMAAKRLNDIVNQGIVARYSGDEFLIIQEKINNKEEVRKKVEEIINSFSIPFSINTRSIFLSFSVGISIYPDDEKDKSSLIKNAYMAMYKAKTKVEKKFHFFDKNLIKERTINNNKVNMESELRKAINNNDFILNYQPQIDLNTEEVTGFEALIRWQHKELGIISPGKFIPLAEETGLIKDIGEWVLKTACQQMKIWQSQGYNPLKMAVNVSIYQIKDPGFVSVVENILNEIGISPEYIELEITENIMRNVNEMEKRLKKLRDIGVKISIDDFGTGYSSLSVLQGLPINTLKIDQSFIDKSTSDEKSAALVKTIIDMGKNLDLNIIAEGIEEEDQVDLLKENNCKVGQGFLFSKPLPVEKIKLKDKNFKIDN